MKYSNHGSSAVPFFARIPSRVGTIVIVRRTCFTYFCLTSLDANDQDCLRIKERGNEHIIDAANMCLKAKFREVEETTAELYPAIQAQ